VLRNAGGLDTAELEEAMVLYLLDGGCVDEAEPMPAGMHRHRRTNPYNNPSLDEDERVTEWHHRQRQRPQRDATAANGVEPATRKAPSLYHLCPYMVIITNDLEAEPATRKAPSLKPAPARPLGGRLAAMEVGGLPCPYMVIMSIDGN